MGEPASLGSDDRSAQALCRAHRGRTDSELRASVVTYHHPPHYRMKDSFEEGCLIPRRRATLCRDIYACVCVCVSLQNREIFSTGIRGLVSGFRAGGAPRAPRNKVSSPLQACAEFHAFFLLFRPVLIDHLENYPHSEEEGEEEEEEEENELAKVTFGRDDTSIGVGIFEAY